MRGETYVYRHLNGDLHLHRGGDSLALDWESAEELVAMIWHGMDEDERKAAMERASKRHGGNFGADGVRVALGKPTVMEEVGTLTERAMKERCARDSDWCDGEICKMHGVDCPNADR
jgi:hypothetical protein